MKKKIIVLFLVFILMALGIFYYFGFVSMSTLPKGEYLASYPNETVECEVRVYRCDGGATVGYSIRGEVEYNNGKIKNIYWSYHEDAADVYWVDNEKVSINGTILNIYDDVYDWRRD